MCCCASRASSLPGSDTNDSAARRRAPLHFVVSCFGFFLPPKGIYQLIQAFALAKSVQPMLRLKLLNSLYPIEASTEYAHQCMRLIGEKNLRGDVHVSTAFLDHEETLRELGDSDLVVLPVSVLHGILERRGRLRDRVAAAGAVFGPSSLR